MDISVMLLKLSALKMSPQAAEPGMPTDSDNVVAAARGCQRKAKPKMLVLTTLFQKALQVEFLSQT